MNMRDEVSIYWLKRDFRLLDNPALTEALGHSSKTLMLNIIEPSMLEAPETSVFHLHAIESAHNELRSRLLAKTKLLGHVFGEAVATFERLYQIKAFKRIYAHQEIGLDRTYQRDIEVEEWCKKRDVQWIQVKQTGVFRGLKNRDQRASLWQEFYESPILPVPSLESLSKLALPEEYLAEISTEPIQLASCSPQYATFDPSLIQEVSEKNAHATLKSFLTERGINYSGSISSPLTAFEAGSRLSVHLAWGSISPRYVYHKTNAQKNFLKSSNNKLAGKWNRSLTAFQARLHWRDHFIQRLETEPQMEFQALNTAYEQVVYRGSREDLQVWLNGQTGFPLVDACMRCLQETGFINFRMRAMITSFACHVLHLNWKDVNPPMAQLYLDYEPGIHLSQLQMQAGIVGINTIRVYNPSKQMLDQDPNCEFVKKWIPELQPFTTQDIFDHSDTSLGTYPPQIVDYKSKSKEMRALLWSIKGQEETKSISKIVYQKHGSRKRSRNAKKTPAKKG